MVFMNFFLKNAMTQGNLGIHPKIAHLKNSMQHCEWELYLCVIINNALIRSQSFPVWKTKI